MWAREHGAARAIPSCWNVPQHHGQPGSLENLLLVPETWQRDTPTSPCHERGTCFASRLRQKHQRTPSMIVAITSHLVYQYWPYRLLPICLLDCVINIQFQGKNNSWGQAAPATVQSAAKKSRLCNNQILQDFMAKLRKPTDLRKPLGCASNSSQVWSKCHVYIIIISSFFHTHKATFTFGPHNIWLFPNRPPSFSPVSGGKDAPKGVHLKWQKIGSVSSGLTQLGQSKPQTKIGFSQFTRMLKKLSGFKEDWSWFNFEWKLCTKQPRWYCHLPFLCLYNLWVPCQGASRWVLVFWLLSILWRFNSYEAENKDGGNELLPGKHCQDDGENGLNKQTTMRGKL